LVRNRNRFRIRDGDRRLVKNIFLTSTKPKKLTAFADFVLMVPINLQNPRSQDKEEIRARAEGIKKEGDQKAKDHKRSPIGGNAEEKTEDRKDRSLNTSGNVQRQTKSGLSAKRLQLPFDSSLPNPLRLKNGFLLFL
jgi:hypothetical protein